MSKRNWKTSILIFLDFDLFGIYSLELADEKELKEYKALNPNWIKNQLPTKNIRNACSEMLCATNKDVIQNDRNWIDNRPS